MFKSENTEYELLSMREIETALQNFDEDLVIDTITSIYNNSINNPTEYDSGIYVDSIETLFQSTIAAYGDHSNEIRAKRLSIYNKIIERITVLANVPVLGTPCEHGDAAYAKARFLCHFFINSTFRIVCCFYTNYIIKEKTSLFNMASIISDQQLTASAATKKTYKAGDKMAALVSNIGTILNNITCFDITADAVASNAFGVTNPDIVPYATYVLGGMDDGTATILFKDFIVPYTRLHQPRIMSNLRFALASEVPGVKINDFLN